MQPSEVQSRWRRLDQNQKVNGLSSRPQPSGHLPGDQSSVTVAAQEVGTRRLCRAQRLEMVSGHGLDRLRRRFTVKAVRRKRIQRLVLSKETRKLSAVEPATAVEEDKGRLRPSTLDFDESRSSFDGYLAFKESRCYMLYRRPAKQGG